MPTAVEQDALMIRLGPQPGDLGTVLRMHGEIYAGEYRFTEEFEAHVARGLAQFAAALGAARENPVAPEPGWLWLAERRGEVVGTIALTDEGSDEAQLRWFLVAPDSRGGLGRRMLDTLLEHARARGFERVRLWTVEGLDAAASLYARAGFTCSERRPVHQWGHDLVEAHWDLSLTR